jgi:hypothetical protein
MSAASRATAAAFLLVILAGCSLNFTEPRKFALVYGVTRYLNDEPKGGVVYGTPNLSYPGADASSLENMLLAQGFNEVRTRIIDYNGVDQALGQPTKANLIADLTYFASKVGSNDLFLFYYSGHGTQTVGAAQTVHEWIAPLGTLVSTFAGSDTKLGNWTIDLNAAVRDDALGTMLDVLPTKRRVVILDSCNSGGFIGSGIETDTVPPQLFGHTAEAGRITPATIAKAIQNYSAFSTSGAAGAGGISPYKALVIAAAGADEFSYEAGAPYYHGIATYYLLQAPASGDLNGDGVVTALETFALIKAGIDQTWNSRYANTDSVFAPHVSGGPIDLVLF